MPLDAAEEDAPALFDLPPDWTKLWTGMPEFDQRDLEPWASLPIHFACRADRDAFAKLIRQTITDDTRSAWYPKAEIGHYADRRYKSSNPVNPKYPVYVISKGRWESRLTVKALEKIGVPFKVVVEPQEFDQYASVIRKDKILTLPFSDLGKGSIPARNWVWEHSLANGDKRHWIIDDNIEGFYRLHKNLKTPVGDGTIFRCMELFTDRFENVGISGPNYFMFASRKCLLPPYYLNTRVYSCILIKNDIPYRWRGRYNEDTDLCIRALKDKWVTILFNAFLAGKSQTMTMKGGNTDELYQGDGRLEMAKSLQEQHPDCVKITRKWDRWQHHVDYERFCNNKILPSQGVSVKQEPDNFGMELEIIGSRKNGSS